MGIKFEGQVLKFGTVDKCNRKFAPGCKITFPEKIPVAYNFDMDEIIGHADISKVEDGLKGVVSLFDTNILPGNEYFVGGYYTRIKTHVEDRITVIDSGRLVSMSIVPEHNVADENLKVRWPIPAPQCTRLHQKSLHWMISAASIFLIRSTEKTPIAGFVLEIYPAYWSQSMFLMSPL